MEAGTYYVGDLGYVLSDNDWDEIVRITNMGNWKTETFGMFQMKSGVSFCNFRTTDGDGKYQDTEGRIYKVDSGRIGCIPITCMSTYSPYGNVVSIHESFTPFIRDSIIYMGTIEIDTEQSMTE